VTNASSWLRHDDDDAGTLSLTQPSSTNIDPSFTHPSVCVLRHSASLYCSSMLSRPNRHVSSVIYANLCYRLIHLTISWQKMFFWCSVLCVLRFVVAEYNITFIFHLHGNGTKWSLKCCWCAVKKLLTRCCSNLIQVAWIPSFSDSFYFRSDVHSSISSL